MIETIVALVCVVLTVALAQRQGWESWAYAMGLVSLPVVYMLFGLFSTSEGVIFKEFAYGLPFVAIGLLSMSFGFRFSTSLIALAWLVHAGYDLGHDALFVNSGVPSWYPLLCAVFDFGLGGYLVYLASRLPEANLKSEANTA